MTRGPGPRILCVLAALVLAAVTALAGCGDDSRPLNDVTDQPAERQFLEDAAAELDGRSFRQFEPSVDASGRKSVILAFRAGFNLWAQVAEDGYAVHEWEIIADGYRVESTADGSGIVLIPEGVTTTRRFPDRCTDCVSVSGVSVSVRDVFDSNEIAFRIDDPNSVLPSPFPVFHSWTRFSEDELIH